MKSYKHLVNHFLNLGGCISVFDGEEWPVVKSQDADAILAAVESVEESKLRIYDAADKRVGIAYIIPQGLDDWEDVYDMSDTPELQAWSQAYVEVTLQRISA